MKGKCAKCGGVYLHEFGELVCINCGYSPPTLDPLGKPVHYTAHTMTALQRRRLALALHEEGMPWADIAIQCEYAGADQARRAVGDYLKSLTPASHERYTLEEVKE